jgi:hypothetical protein
MICSEWGLGYSWGWLNQSARPWQLTQLKRRLYPNAGRGRISQTTLAGRVALSLIARHFPAETIRARTMKNNTQSAATRRTILAGLGATTGAVLMTSSAEAQDIATLNALLGRYVSVGADGLNRVNYAAWRGNAADKAALNAFITGSAAERPSTMARNAAFAYWANLYNAITIKVILDNPPVRSIRDIRSRGTGLDPAGFTGPWREKRVTVEGTQRSLDDIEHSIMRRQFRDPLVHYSVNCASVGCPNLRNRAWVAATLTADLETAARAFINSRRGVRVQPDGSIRVSSIYNWFKADFGGNDAGVLAHLRRYASAPLSGQITGNVRISGDDYNWALNGPGSPAA